MEVSIGKSSIDGGFSSTPCLITGGYDDVMMVQGWFRMLFASAKVFGSESPAGHSQSLRQRLRSKQHVPEICLPALKQVRFRTCYAGVVDFRA